MKTLQKSILCFLLLGSFLQNGTAQDSSARLTSRAFPSAAYIRATRGVPEGASAAMIDQRGYLITAFHSIGPINGATGVPGSFYSKSNRYEIEIYPPNGDVPSRWIARVVAGDIRTDLALLRIMAPLDGRSIQDWMVFPALNFGQTRAIGRGSRVWVAGFSNENRPPAIMEISITNVDRSQLGRLAWLSFDRKLPTTMAGSMVLNSFGEIVGIATGTLVNGGDKTNLDRARPVERIPSAWLEALRRGHITETTVEGIPRLPDAGEINELAEGDGPEQAQKHFFIAPQRRPSVVYTNPKLAMQLISPKGQVFRKGQGSVKIEENDPANSVVQVDVSKSKQNALAYSIRTDSSSARKNARVDGNLPWYSETFSKVPGKPVGNGATLTGRLVHAITGEPLRGAMVNVGKPGTNMERLLGEFLRGEIGRTQFEVHLLGQARTNRSGDFVVHNLPQGKSLPVAGYKPTFRPVYLKAHIAASAKKVNLGKVKVTYWEPIAY
ncbi:MAG: trypsin-like peptidase domain-containing protein [Myxococcales bacterium]|nr:MAG: trypsin-like peptidase domain-containing protein [Myxococcales bacterium]